MTRRPGSAVSEREWLWLLELLRWARHNRLLDRFEAQLLFARAIGLDVADLAEYFGRPSDALALTLADAEDRLRAALLAAQRVPAERTAV